MLEQWFSDYCAKCKSRNFINNGDPSDQTVMDVEGIRCWNCGHCWRLEEVDEIDQDNINDDPYYEDGVHFEEVKHEKNT
jgi:hypothetical protein